MSYIGKEPQFTQYPSKFFNGDGTAMTVSLDYAPPNAAALLVFIDGVRQDTSAYTLSGTSLTFTGTVPSGTNNVQVVHLGLTQDVGVPSDDTISTAKLQDDAVTTAKLDDDSVTAAKLNATGTASSSTFLRGDMAWASAGGDNTPSFRAYLTANQTGTTNAAWNKVNFNSTDWDTDSAFDTSTNYRFTVPTGEGGKYYFVAEVGVAPSAGSDGATDFAQVTIRKNGSALGNGDGMIRIPVNGTGGDVYVGSVMTTNLAASDYVEVYCYHNLGTSRQFAAASSFFAGFKLIGF